MASTNTLTVTIDLSGQEILGVTDFPGGDQEQDRTLRCSLSESAELTSSTTPALDAQALQVSVTIGASPVTIDLTAADIGLGRTVDMTTSRLIAWGVSASSSNTGGITIAPGATNGYAVWGAADSKYVFQPGETAGSVISGAAAARAAVGASAKNISVSGTADDTCEIRLWFGT